MNKLLYIGIITSFHGVKGEVKIKSKLKNKEEIFLISNELIIENVNYSIKSYRRHKDFELITFDGYASLNDVEFLKNKKVYINLEKRKDDSKYRIIGYSVVAKEVKYGIILDIVNYGSCDILEISDNNLNYNIPYLESSIIKIDDIKKEVIVNKEMIM